MIEHIAVRHDRAFVVIYDRILVLITFCLFPESYLAYSVCLVITRIAIPRFDYDLRPYVLYRLRLLASYVF